MNNIQQQIEKTEKYMNSFFGNTSSVKMKKYALQQKLNRLQDQLIVEAILKATTNE